MVLAGWPVGAAVDSRAVGALSTSFSWLHLTDLHAGHAHQHLWPTVEAQVLKDLRRIHARLDRVDAIFFTGDLVHGGLENEWALAGTILGRIRAELAALGSEPVLLAVPGNHDLQRPAVDSGPARLVDVWPGDPRLRQRFWAQPGGSDRQGVAQAFAAWQAWWDAERSAELDDYSAGALAGDYRCTLRAGDRRIGVLAVNSAFLQLRGGDLRGRMSLDARQLAGTFPDGIPLWAQEHDLVVLLTHHPLPWLDEAGRMTLLDELASGGRVSVHLQGHEHHEESAWTSPMAPRRLTLLGRSLFGLEAFGEAGHKHQRLHGYLAGQVTFGPGSRTIRLWPRVGVRRDEGGWHVVPDPDAALTDEATAPQEIGASPREEHALQCEIAASAASPPPVAASSLAGWELLDPAHLAQLAVPLTPRRTERFYDGALPTWSHACDGEAVPVRAIVHEVVDHLQAARAEQAASFVLVIGPAAEGKSTALLQAATRFVADPGWQVLWCPDATRGLDPEAVAQLPPGQWLLVTDDADLLVDRLSETQIACRHQGREDVCVLMAARDTDWVAAGGEHPAWGSMLVRVPLNEMTGADARELVRAWERLGEPGLKDLSSLADENARVARLLVNAAATERDRSSFFGAVLHTRFTAEDLRAHVQRLMNDLGARQPGGETLRRAFVATAACDAAGIDGIDRAVLADLVAVPRSQLGSDVVRALGEEAASVQAGRRVGIRHPDIASAAIALAERGTTDPELGDLYAAIVRQTLLCASRSQTPRSGWFVDVMGLGPRLVSRLPTTDFDAERRLEIAVRAAETARLLDETRPLTRVVTLAKTWRNGGRPDEGRACLAAHAPTVDAMPDREIVARGFFYEWSVCAGLDGDPVTDVALSAYSVSDALNPLPIARRQAKTSLAGFGRACLDAFAETGQREFLVGAAACGLLGLRTHPDHRTRNHFQRYLRVTRKQGVDLKAADAFARLGDAMDAAIALTEDEDVRAIVRAGEQGFEALAATLR